MAGTRAGDDSQLEQLAHEQAALRRVATLVAQGAPVETLFTLVAEQVAEILCVPLASIVRYEPDATATERASVSPSGAIFRVGTRWSLEGTNVVAQIRESGAPARIDDYSGLTGVIAETARGAGIRSTVGSPIVVAGRLWGVMVVSSDEPEPLAPDTEARLADFTELVATAIANGEAREEVERLADEQAALRRVATLVAQDVPSNELFGAVAREVGTLLRADFAGMIRYEDETAVTTVATWAAAGEHPPIDARWATEPGDPTAMIAETGEPVRVEDWSTVPGPLAEFMRADLGVTSSVGCPIVVEGRLWGALAVHSKQDTPLPPDTESRIAQFTDLVATAIANAQARDEVARLAQEQAALRRVATLVARQSSPAEVLGAVAEEVAELVATDGVAILRFEPDGTATQVARSATPWEPVPVGTRFPLEGESVVASVLRTGKTARLDDWADASGALAAKARSLGIRSSVATPIVVEGRVWGTVVAVTAQVEPLPADTESRIGEFTELVATAIANTESHSRAERLTQEQAALRRVATLIAREASQAEIFTGIAEAIGQLLGTEEIRMLRYEGDRSAVVVGSSGTRDAFPLGSRQDMERDSAASRVLQTGRTARIDDYDTVNGPLGETARSIGVRSVVGAPILVEGRLWGAITTGATSGEPLPPETEARLGQFTELMATAIANAEARAEVERLAEEQAALRRVATLVAEGASPGAVLDAVAAEMEELLGADQVALNRFESGNEVILLAHRGLDAERTPVGTRVSTEGESVTATVRRTGRPARMEGYESAGGALAEIARATGLRSSVSAPIKVEGKVWGVITASWKGEQSPPASTEERMAKFAELLDTAIANADSRDQLTASRARLVTAADDARRRVVRDLHDGAQQRFVHAIVTLKLAQRALRQEDEKAEALLGEALQHAEQGNAELRELAHGILPAGLSRGGLRAGVDAFVARLDLPVRVEVSSERLPAEIEASAYFIVAEALTNVMKHAQAARAEVTACVEEDAVLRVEVRDDGVGGADTSGHGLVGMADRVNALGGQLSVESPADGGTLVSAQLPLSADGASA
jgi:GAF domain-containing protein